MSEMKFSVKRLASKDADLFALFKCTLSKSAELCANNRNSNVIKYALKQTNMHCAPLMTFTR